jgi:hypothetical protein
MYFHSKGMVFSTQRLANGTALVRSARNVKLSEQVIKPWRDVVRRFHGDALVNKAGFAAGLHGWMFENFWWARVSYLQQSPQPWKSNNRLVYEMWLGTTTHPASVKSELYFGVGTREKQMDILSFTDSTDSLSMCRGANPDWNLNVNFTFYKSSKPNAPQGPALSIDRCSAA